MSFSSQNTIVGSLMPPHLSGASPTSFYVGNIVLQNIVESGKKILEQKRKSNEEQSVEQEMMPITILNDGQSVYTHLHQLPFIDEADQRMMVESVPFDQLNQRDHHGNTPLMWATIQGDRNLVEMLVDQGAAINTQNLVGETALFMAAARDYVNICNFLLESGADARLSTIDGTSPLHIAAACGNTSLVQTLVGHGAFVNSTDDEGDTPLHYAVREGRRDVVELLIKSFGADFNLENEDGETPRDLANELGEVEISNLISSSFNKMNTVEATEYRLYFNEESILQLSGKKECPLPLQNAGIQYFANPLVAATY